MRKLKCLFFSLLFFNSTNSFASQSITGNYTGVKWGFFRYGKECRVSISFIEGRDGDYYKIKIADEYDEKQLSIKKFDIKTISGKKNKIHIQPAWHVSEFESNYGGTIYFKNGIIDQVSLFSFATCSKLKKISNKYLN